MAIRKILCACGIGLGTSLVVHMNAESALKELGHPEIEVDHTSVAGIDPTSADLFVFAKSFDALVDNVPGERRIVLSDICDAAELKAKLAEAIG